MKKPSYVIVIHSDDITKKVTRKIQGQLSKLLSAKVAVLGVGLNDSVEVHQLTSAS